MARSRSSARIRFFDARTDLTRFASSCSRSQPARLPFQHADPLKLDGDAVKTRMPKLEDVTQHEEVGEPPRCARW